MTLHPAHQEEGNERLNHQDGDAHRVCVWKHHEWGNINLLSELPCPSFRAAAVGWLSAATLFREQRL